jgi:hypothetical protein
MYKIDGKIISGHWEIYPVERIERMGVNSGFKIGPSLHEAARWRRTCSHFGSHSINSSALFNINSL